MSNEIIVTARPDKIFQTTDYYPKMPSGVVAGQVVASDMARKSVVTIAGEAKSNEIVVTGEKIKAEVIKIAVGSAISGVNNAILKLPCIGNIMHNEIASIAKNIHFNLDNTEYGEGRAGENLAGSTGSEIVINANATEIHGYSKIENGITYLVAHEIAHSLNGMQKYDNEMWKQFLAGANPSFSAEQLRRAYAFSPQFAANEARTNTVARAIAQAYGLKVMENPPHGFQTC